MWLLVGANSKPSWVTAHTKEEEGIGLCYMYLKQDNKF